MLTDLARGILEGELNRLRQVRLIEVARLTEIEAEKDQVTTLITSVDTAITDIESVLHAE